MSHTQGCLDSKEKFREIFLAYGTGKITGLAVEESERASRGCPACQEHQKIALDKC